MTSRPGARADRTVVGAVSAPAQVVPAPRPARSASSPIADYLSSLQVERGAARNTLLAYRRDLGAILDRLTAGASAA